MLPGHLIFLTLASVAAAAVTAAGWFFGNLNFSGLFFVLGGIELLYLGLAPRSKRLVHAINAKYANELDGFYRLQEITRHYNELSATAQRRFESFRALVIQAKGNFSRLKENFPELVESYVGKIDALQLSYIRHLSLQDSLPRLMAKDNAQTLETRILEMRQGLAQDPPALREVKEKRLAVLEERRASFQRASESLAMVEVQLQTLEDTVRYFIEHPLTQPKSLEETGMLDQMLQETQNLHSTLAEVAGIMGTEGGTLPPVRGSDGTVDIQIS